MAITTLKPSIIVDVACRPAHTLAGSSSARQEEGAGNGEDKDGEVGGGGGTQSIDHRDVHTKETAAEV